MSLGFVSLLIAALLGLCTPVAALEQPRDPVAPTIGKPPMAPPTQTERSARPALDKSLADIAFLESRLKLQLIRLAALDAEIVRLARERQAAEDELAALTARLRALLPKLWEMDVRLKGMMSAPTAPWDETDRSLSWLGAAYAQARAELSRASLKNSELTANLGKEAGLAPQAQAQAAQVEKTRDALLAERLKLQRELISLRQERFGPQEQLERVLELVAQADLAPASTRDKPLEASQGQLERPVSGQLAARFDPGASPPRNGVGFKTAKGETVRCAFWGRVAFAGDIKGLGRVVIVAHGGAAATVYAHLSRLAVKPGQDVARADALGEAGEYPSPGDSGMSFELRFGLKPSNPSRWFVVGHVAVPPPVS